MALTPLCTVLVDLGDAAFAVRSALPTRPIAGDRIRYGPVELDVVRVVVDVGVSATLEVHATPSITTARMDRDELERRLMALRFRREAQDNEPATPAP